MNTIKKYLLTIFVVVLIWLGLHFLADLLKIDYLSLACGTLLYMVVYNELNGNKDDIS